MHTQSVEMRSLSKSNLESLLKETIMAYVKIKEGKYFKCEAYYDLNYIQSSKLLSAHRKRNMEELDALLEYYRDNENNLANAIKQFLGAIKNKPSLFCLEEKPSLLKRMLATALRKHNQSLFLEPLPQVGLSEIADLKAALKQVLEQNKVLQAQLEQACARNLLLEQQLNIKESTLKRLTPKPGNNPSGAPSCFFGKSFP